MKMKPVLILLAVLLFPTWAGAWEEDQVVEFILAYSPILQAQRDVTQTYTPSTKFSDKLYEHTQLYAQVGAGGTEYQPGALTTFAGVRVAIPLASPKEEREHAEKLLQETEKIDEVRGQVLTDIAQLRQYEANLAAAENQQNFYEAKSKWLEDRIKQGYEEAEVLWENTKQLNTVVSETIKFKLLIEAQRKKIAQYAGDQWKVLLAYLSGKGKLPKV